MRAGTTLLHGWLADHPEVCVPEAFKEADFFSRYYDRGLDWYLRIFRPTTERAVGEFSVTYLESEEALDRIARDLPGVRCLVSLRDPVTRLDSEYRHVARLTGFGGDRRTFISGRPGALERGRYGRQLAGLFERFPADRIKVLVFEDFVRDPLSAVRELYEFVGVDAGHLPPAVGARVNRSPGASRWPAVERLAQRANRLAKDRDYPWLRRAGRSRALRRLRSLNAGRGGPAPMEARLAAELRALYAEDVAEVSTLLGRDLRRVWRAGGSTEGNDPAADAV